MKYWAEQIQIAKELGHFTQEAKQNVNDMASCAVGERMVELGIQSKLYQYSEVWKVPKSDYLVYHRLKDPLRGSDLGMDFFYAVTANRIADAEAIYNKIQTLQ